MFSLKFCTIKVNLYSQLADMLPSKTIPDVSNRKGHALKHRTRSTAGSAARAKKKARTSINNDDIESEATTPNSSNSAVRNTTISPPSSFQIKVGYVS
jgi:hypothetical protein